MFKNPEESMFYAGSQAGKGIITATLGSLSDTIKVTVYENKKKENNGNGKNKGKQLSIMPGDTIVENETVDIQYFATYKTNGNKHQNASFNWSVSDTSIASINNEGLLTLSGKTGFTLVNCEYSNFGASVELLVVDSTLDATVNTISLVRVLPSGKELKTKTISEGGTHKLGGLPFPLNLLNGGRIHFPFGCIDEDIKIYMFIPEEYAESNKDSTEIVLSGEIITGVRFNVQPSGIDSIVEPYWFNIPIELSLVYKKELLDSLGVDPMDLDVFFAENAGFVDAGEGIVSIDSARNRLHASIEHFSTILVRENTAKTSVLKLEMGDNDFDIYPNPLNNYATVRFKLAQKSKVVIDIYNLAGQKTKILTNGEFESGVHTIKWNADNMNYLPVKTGIYLCRMTINDSVTKIQKIIVNR
jgi:hypothetical protein